MSWNWCSRTVSPDAVQVVGRVGEPGAHGRRRRPQLGLPQQVFAAAVALLGLCLAGEGGAVEFEVQLADPDGRLGVLGLGLREEGLRGLHSTVAEPSRSRSRAALATISRWCRRLRHPSRVGARECRATPLSLKLRAAWAISLPLHRAVVGVDGREVGEDPGAADAFPAEGVVRNLFVCDQEIFCVSRYLVPAALMICGSPAAKPKVSGSHASSFSTPNSSRKNRLPCTNCRHRLRARHVGVRLTHMPRRPATNRPSATAFFTRAHTSGRWSRTHAHCWACDMAKTKSAHPPGGRSCWRSCGPPCARPRAAATATPSRCARARPR